MGCELSCIPKRKSPGRVVGALLLEVGFNWLLPISGFGGEPDCLLAHIHLSSVPKQEISVWPEPLRQRNLAPLKGRKGGFQKFIFAG